MPLTCFHFARGLLPASGASFFFFNNVTAPSQEGKTPHAKKNKKHSASKQIRPEPLKRSGCVQDPFSLHVNQMMQRHAQTRITSVLVPSSANSMYEPKNRVLTVVAASTKYIISYTDYLFVLFSVGFHSPIVENLQLLVYIYLPLLCSPPCSPDLQATGRCRTLNKNCHPGQLAAMKHLFCLTFPGT